MDPGARRDAGSSKKLKNPALRKSQPRFVRNGRASKKTQNKKLQTLKMGTGWITEGREGARGGTHTNTGQRFV